MTEKNLKHASRVLIALSTARIMWSYVDEMIDYCALQKLSSTHKLCQSIRTLKREYEASLASHLDARHMYVANHAGDSFAQSFSYDLLVLYCTLTNDLCRKYAGEEIPHLEAKGKALCAITLRRALHTLPDSVHLPKLYELDKLLTEFVAPYELDLTTNIELAQTILARKLASIPEMKCDLELS